MWRHCALVASSWQSGVIAITFSRAQMPYRCNVGSLKDGLGKGNMRRLPPLQLAREITEVVMVMNANGRSFYNQTLDELAFLHRRMKEESEYPLPKRDIDDLACFSENLPVGEEELIAG